MRKAIPFLFVILLISCGHKWSKDYVYDDCMREMKKDKDVAKMFSVSQMEDICDCSADKAFNKYKTEAEAKRDNQGMMDIGADCARQVLAK